jgi:hypothetical protein
MNMMSLQAEDELERIKANWEASTSRAVAEGIHIACRAPIGYLRADQANPRYDARGKLIRDGRLVEDPETADAIRNAFTMRAAGESYGAIQARLPRRVAKSTLSAVFQNRAYLGEARGPNGAVKKGAHPALVAAGVFSRVRPGKAPPRTGTASKALLTGIITCAGCDHRLSIVSSTNRQGERRPSYACRIHHKEGDCRAPAVGLVELVDGEVASRLAQGWEQIAVSTRDADSRWLAAKDALAKAEAVLDEWVSDDTIQQALSKTRFQQGILVRQAAVEEAERTLWQMPDPGIDADAPVVWLDGKPMTYEVWGENVEADRRHLRRHVASVKLAKPDPKRRRWQPIAERVTVEFVGGVQAALAA